MFFDFALSLDPKSKITGSKAFARSPPIPYTHSNIPVTYAAFTMSRIATGSCPLSDCTLAVDNAENIRNSNDKALQGLKVDTLSLIVPSPRKTARSVKTVSGVVAAEKAPSVRRGRVSAGGCKVLTTTTTANAADGAAQATALEVHRPSALDVHVFAKPFIPLSTPHRNDPYSLCLLNSPCTPEASFFACYADTAEVSEVAEAASAMHTPVRGYAGSQRSTLGETTRNLLEMFSLISTPSKSPCRVTPVRVTEAVSACSSLERAASPPLSPPQPPTTSTRVVRKVVNCNVDRTSGRPVPKPRAV